MSDLTEETEDIKVSFQPVANYSDDDVSAEEPAQARVLKIKDDSERMEKLRSYYGALGQVRLDIKKELENMLKGAVTEGEIEAKLYEYSHSWKTVADEINRLDDLNGRRHNLDGYDNHVGQNLAGMDFSGEDLSQKDFSAANLQDAHFNNAHLAGADFTGADLSGVDFSGADLRDVIFAGAKLKGTNFTGAHMEGVILRDADIEDAILLDIAIDELALEELQALVEYLAVYYPHKLNLKRINLSLLDLKRIDLRWVNLRGVDFTGLNFTGVNIMELDLSECIITPEQIAQALGRIPAAEELKRIMAPKKKKKEKPFYIDFSDFLGNGEFKGWVDLTKNSVSTDDVVKGFLKVRSIILQKPMEKDEVIFEKAKAFHAERLNAERQMHNEEQRRNIEERKQQLREGKEQATKAEKYVPLQVNLENTRRDM